VAEPAAAEIKSFPLLAAFGWQQEFGAGMATAAFAAAEVASTYQSCYTRAYVQAVRQGGSSSGSTASLYERWLAASDSELDGELRSDQFARRLSRYVDAMVALRAILRRAGQPVDQLDRAFDQQVRSMMVLASAPKNYELTPHDTVYENGKVRLLRFRGVGEEEKGQGKKEKPPLLVVYAPINRFHILDINPGRSVVGQLLAGGLDVYLLDWGYPDRGDDGLSLDDYLQYTAEAADAVIRLTGAEKKISMLGYCWGGILALMHAALHPERIERLAIMAAPVDFDKDSTLLATWVKKVDSDAVIDEFGHMDGQVLDIAFLMRNPARYGFDKYLKLAARAGDAEFVDMFVDVERWLYDTPPVPGALYRQIIDYCYRKNLLVKPGGIKVAAGSIDLRRIKAPLLLIAAEGDDLVSPESTIAARDHVGSSEVEVVTVPGGHVGLCISSQAHKKLWPRAAGWLSGRPSAD
jgi:polyhydroxyalkanoate synthase